MNVYPMTVEQEVMWLHDYLTDGPSRNLESWVYRMSGPVDRTAVHRAWEGIAARHDALRTGFGLADHRPVQWVRPESEPPLLATRRCPVEDVDETLRELVCVPIDLSRQAVRATLLEVGAETIILVVQMHHIVLDDWSLHIMEREFEEHYRARTEGRPVDLERVPLQPGPYAVQQRSAPRNPAVLEYWRRNLADLPAGIGNTLPADDPPAERTGQGARALFTVAPPISRRLRRLCGMLRVTPFTVFATAVSLLLYKAGSGNDLVIATPVSRRGSANCDQMIAPLSETLPLRLRVQPGDTFADLIAQVRARTHEAIEFRDLSSADLGPVARRNGHAVRDLYRTVIVLDDGADSGVRIPGVQAERLFVFSGLTTKSDLCFFFTAAGSRYNCMLDYATDRYSSATARRWIDRMLTLLDAVTSDPGGSIASLPRY